MNTTSQLPLNSYQTKTTTLWTTIFIIYCMLINIIIYGLII